MDTHDCQSKNLFSSHCLQSLVFLIEAGRELEFRYDETEYFISRSNAAEHVSLWCDGVEQSFDSMENLIHHALLGTIPFRKAWLQTELICLF